ncbi:hypothetical protein FXO37_22765 [Capsicum annuum]|nr:hypothetical protein FXO37_22765 [Capsicum annuum]
MIQGFDQRGQRAMGFIKLGISMDDFQSNPLMHVIDAKTSYNVLLGRPWVHGNKIISSSYYQCLKYLKNSMERTIVANYKPFTEAESHFTDAKFYLKNHIIDEKRIEDVTKIKCDDLVSKKVAVTIEKFANRKPFFTSNKESVAPMKKKAAPVLRYVPKVKKEEDHSPDPQDNVLKGLTLSIRKIDAINPSSRPLGESVAQNPLPDMAFPTKHTKEGFDLNAYKLFVKAGYNPNEPSKLGKLPSEGNTRKACEGLGYAQPPPICISIRKAVSNYNTVEEKSIAANKRSSIFDRLGESTARTSVFERLGYGKIKAL